MRVEVQPNVIFLIILGLLLAVMSAHKQTASQRVTTAHSRPTGAGHYKRPPVGDMRDELNRRAFNKGQAAHDQFLRNAKGR